METSIRKIAAQKLLQLNEQNKEHEKRAQATRLIYKQAEMGYGDVPRSYSELQEKVASLLTQDLLVLEKALELTGGNIKLGELDKTDYSHSNGSAEYMFNASILGNENDY